MSSQKFKGIVVRKTNYAEADRIFTFITASNGKVDAIAKGVRKQKSKLSGALELFCESDIQVYKTQSLHIVTSARISHQFKGILDGYETMKLGYLMLEMVNKLTDTGTSLELYNLLYSSLDTLGEHKTDVATLELIYKLRLLDELGHLPDLEPKSRGDKYFFDFDKGTVEATNKAGIRMMTEEELKLWRVIVREPLAKLLKLQDVGEISKRSLSLLSEFIHFTFNTDFRSEQL